MLQALSVTQSFWCQLPSQFDKTSPLVRVLTLNKSILRHKLSPVDPPNFLRVFQNLISGKLETPFNINTQEICPRNIADANRRVKSAFSCLYWDRFNFSCSPAHYWARIRETDNSSPLKSNDTSVYKASIKDLRKEPSYIFIYCNVSFISIPFDLVKFVSFFLQEGLT